MTLLYDRRGFIIRPAVADDIRPLSERMRKAEVDEVWALGRLTPFEAVQFSFTASAVAYTVEYQGEPVAMFGVQPVSFLSADAVVWMLTASTVEKARLRFLRASRSMIRFLLGIYPELHNVVDARHSVCVKWLRWCGATVQPALPMGPDQLPFHPFTFGEKSWA